SPAITTSTGMDSRSVMGGRIACASRGLDRCIAAGQGCRPIMSGAPETSFRHSVAAAQDWWREAGVDLLFDDEPSGWLDVDAPGTKTRTAAAKPAGSVAARVAEPAAPPMGG